MVAAQSQETLLKLLLPEVCKSTSFSPRPGVGSKVLQTGASGPRCTRPTGVRSGYVWKEHIAQGHFLEAAEFQRDSVSIAPESRRETFHLKNTLNLVPFGFRRPGFRSQPNYIT